jgi:uncharacterized iron-regulated membrane protein
MHMNTSSSKPGAPKSKNWLLAKSRQWHLWGGLLAGIFLLIVAATGIVLNYKKPIFSALGLEREAKAMKATDENSPQPVKRDKSSAQLTTVTGFSAASVSADQALQLARENLGDVALERIELKDEHGTLLYKIKSRSGEELHVNAVTGVCFVKGAYEKVKTARDGSVMARTTDWGKIMLDLHTGKIGGEVGKAIMTFAAGIMLLLTLSGVYMWLKPLLIRRQNAKARAAANSSAGVAVAPAGAKPELVKA